MLKRTMPERAAELLKNAERDAKAQYDYYSKLANIKLEKENNNTTKD